MRRTLIAGITVAALSAAVPASAADLARPVYKAPVAAPVAGFTWTGVYLGAHVGYGWANKDWTQTFGDPGGFFGVPCPGFACDRASGDSDGIVGGIQLGVNYQIGAWVWGLETDWAWTDMDGAGRFVVFPAYSAQSDVNWIYTITGRVGFAGWANGRALLYVKGGFAAVDDDHFIRFGGLTVTNSPGGSRHGWVAGFGAEWAFHDHWSAKIEYNYVNLEDKTRDFTYNAAPAGLFEQYRIEQDMHLIKFGLNYRFWAPAPVIAKN